MKTVIARVSDLVLRQCPELKEAVLAFGRTRRLVTLTPRTPAINSPATSNSEVANQSINELPKRILTTRDVLLATPPPPPPPPEPAPATARPEVPSLENWKAELKNSNSLAALKQHSRQLFGYFPTYVEKNTQECVDFERALYSRAEELSRQDAGAQQAAAAQAAGGSPLIGGTGNRPASAASSVNVAVTQRQTVFLGIPTVQQVIGVQAGDVVANAVALFVALRQARQATESALEELQNSRSLFWKEYPTGSNPESAREAYARALLAKDLKMMVNLIVRQVSSSQGDAVTRQLFRGILQEIGYAEYDHGVAPMARKQFEAWAMAVIGQRRQGKDMAAAFEATAGLMLDYIRQRDAAEFLFTSPNSPLLRTDSTPESYLAALLLTDGTSSEAYANSKVEELRRRFGSEGTQFLAAAMRKITRVEPYLIQTVWDESRGFIAAFASLEHVATRNAIGLPFACGNPWAEDHVRQMNVRFVRVENEIANLKSERGASENLLIFADEAAQLLEQMRDLTFKAIRESDASSARAAYKIRDSLLQKINVVQRTNLAYAATNKLNVLISTLQTFGDTSESAAWPFREFLAEQVKQ